MIIGTGLLANAFLNSNLNFDDCIIFASGVSNSLEKNSFEFKRETDLLENTINKNNTKTFVYFSTCSINDSTKKPYTKHKIEIEKKINKTDNYLILRLPNIVGKSLNSNQLTNFIHNNINNDINFDVYENVQRYLIDVEDIPIITRFLLDNSIKNRTIDIVFNNSIFMVDLIKIFEKVLNKQANVVYKNDNSLNYVVDYNVLSNYLNDYDNKNVFNTDVDKIITKYYSRKNLY